MYSKTKHPNKCNFSIETIAKGKGKIIHFEIMEEICKYESIEQFRHVVKQVGYHDKDGSVISFNGTVKLHGTNACIGYKPSQPIWCQSRTRVITSDPKSDNCGFAGFVSSHEDIISDYIESLSILSDIDENKNEYLLFFGEWCGKGIQKGVGISQLPKRFIVFDIERITPNPDCEDTRYYYPSDIVKTFCLTECMIWNIYQFKNWNIEIDFSAPKSAQDKLIEITNSVENECPVAKYFGVSGIGEGVVWRSVPRNFIFKVKGSKHSVTNPKKIASASIENLESSRKFIDYALTIPRLEQGWSEIMTGIDLDMKHIGKFLKWIISDVIKEESDTLSENNLTIKDVTKELTLQAKKWFINNLDSQLGIN